MEEGVEEGVVCVLAVLVALYGGKVVSQPAEVKVVVLHVRPVFGWAEEQYKGLLAESRGYL